MLEYWAQNYVQNYMILIEIKWVANISIDEYDSHSDLLLTIRLPTYEECKIILKSGRIVSSKSNGQMQCIFIVFPMFSGFCVTDGKNRNKSEELCVICVNRYSRFTIIESASWNKVTVQQNIFVKFCHVFGACYGSIWHVSLWLSFSIETVYI